MLLEMPEVFKNMDYYEGIPLILWLIGFGLYILGFILFFREGKRMELKSQKMANYAYGTFMLGMGITRIVFIIAIYIPEAYDFWTTLGYITGLIGLIFWLYVLETFLVQKTKKIFTIISIIAFGFSSIALFGVISRDLALNIQYILLPFSIGIILILYIYLIAKTTGTVRRKVEWILIGLFLIAAAQVLDGQTFIEAVPTFPLIIPPIIMISGILIFISSQLFHKG